MNGTKLVLLGLTLCAAAASGCDGNVEQETTGTAGATTTASGGSGGATTTGGGGAGGATTTAAGGAGGTPTASGGAGGGPVTTGGGGAGGTTTTTSTTTTTGTGDGDSLAVRVLRMGDQLPDGTPSSTAWKGYGFDLDGKVSTAASVDLCKPFSGAAPAAVYPDGDNGIDNSFGKNILPIFQSLAADFSAQINDAIETGQFTLLLNIDGIDPGATGTFLTRLYTGSFPDGVVPAWNGLDAWPVRSDSLVGGDIASPKTQFPMSEVTDVGGGTRVWESKGEGDLLLVLPTGGLTMMLPIHHARLSMVLSGDDKQATMGRIGGVLDTEELVAELAKLAGSFDPSLCPPSATFQSIANQMRQASDILADGTQDPAVTCNGISIGLGFDAESAGLGAPFDAPVLPDPCNP